MFEKRLFFALSLSVTAHLVAVFSFSPYFCVRKTPVIYCWANILKKQDLFCKNSKMDFPKGLDFPLGKIRQDYFSKAWDNDKGICRQVDKKDYSSPQETVPQEYVKESSDYLYLWERHQAFTSKNKEKIPYKILCSSSGKVILIYPQKLSVDSQKNISVQKYLRQAVCSLNNKFSWTKLDGVIE